LAAWARIKKSLGAAYLGLSDLENKAENCRYSAEAFLDAIQFYKPETFTADYALIESELGVAYRRESTNTPPIASWPSNLAWRPSNSTQQRTIQISMLMCI
jgi:hypothetical protein